jgi:hypothetical protein
MREIAQAYAAQAAAEPAVTADQQRVLEQLEELRKEQERLNAEQDDLLAERADLCRLAHRNLGLSVPVIAKALGMVRQSVWDYINGVTAADHKRLDEIGAPN